jgi:uncharacterized protein (TIGR02145 family)
MKKIYILIIIVSLLASCQDEHYVEGKIETKGATDITGETATLTGSITITNNPKKKPITIGGFIYAENKNELVVSEGSSNIAIYDIEVIQGNFSTNIFDLKPRTRYYAQAFFELRTPKYEPILYYDYVSNIFYGNIIEFTTGEAKKSPSVTTLPAESITNTSVTFRGNITDVGNPPYTSKGICYSTQQNPTINDSKVVVQGNGTGEFEGTAISLLPNTTYYFRAYATNSAEPAYGNQMNFKTTSFTCGSTITDVSGNSYNTVQIGTQCWMRENLRTIKYNDATNIPNLTNDNDWSNTYSGAYCYYNNSSSNASSYGALYNWYAVNTGKLCPSGWHVPTVNEFDALIDYLGGNNAAGGEMKTTGYTYWYSPNPASNSSNFSARGGGSRYDTESTEGDLGVFEMLKYWGIFWTSSSGVYYNYAINRSCIYSDAMISQIGYGDHNYEDKMSSGNSVRCIKNGSKSEDSSDFTHPIDKTLKKIPKDEVKYSSTRD